MVVNKAQYYIAGPPVIISMLGVVVGCMLAVWLVPASLTTENDLRASAIVFSIGLLLGPVLSALRQPINILHPVSVLLIGIVYWLLFDLLQARYLPEARGADSVMLSFIAIGLFASGVCVGNLYKAKGLSNLVFKAANWELTSRLLFIIGLIAFVFAFLRFAIPSDFDLLRMYEALFLPRWSAPWARGAYGGWGSFLDHMVYFGYVLPPLVVLLYRSEGRLSFRVILIFFFTIIILSLVAQGGGRRVIGALIVTAGVAWVLTARRQGRSVLFAALVGIPALLMYLQFILITRNVGVGSLTQYNVTESIMKHGVHVDDNFNRLGLIIDILPRYIEHVGFDWLIWLIVRPIPRILWPDKPVDAGFQLAQYFGRNDVSWTSSIVGETYMAFGFTGCLIFGIIYGLLGRKVAVLTHYRAQPSAVIMYSIALLALFLGVRSAVDLILFSYAILAWILILNYILSKKVLHKRRPYHLNRIAGKNYMPPRRHLDDKH